MLYFLKTLDYYKVGFTENLNSRMKVYASDNPIAELLGIKDGTKQDEKRYQISFCNYEGTGEWYKLPESVVKEIQKDFIPSDALIHHKKKFRTESEEYRKLWRKRDRREYYKERAKRPERKGYMNEYLKKYRESLTEEQKDKYKEYQRKYREEHREELRQKQKERREKNKAAS